MESRRMVVGLCLKAMMEKTASYAPGPGTGPSRPGLDGQGGWKVPGKRFEDPKAPTPGKGNWLILALLAAGAGAGVLDYLIGDKKRKDQPGGVISDVASGTGAAISTIGSGVKNIGGGIGQFARENPVKTAVGAGAAAAGLGYAGHKLL